MTERLIEKLDRLGAEAGINEMTPKMRRFALLVAQDVVAQWPKRPWVELTDEQRINISYKADGNECVAVELTEAKLKELNHD
jgi:hypothetical protein